MGFGHCHTQRSILSSKVIERFLENCSGEFCFLLFMFIGFLAFTTTWGYGKGHGELQYRWKPTESYQRLDGQR